MSFVATEDQTGSERGCSRPDLNRSVSEYCFGDLTEQQRDQFEAHLLECPICWQEVQRLDAVVRALRTEKSLTRQQYAQDLVSLAGISSLFNRFLAGHWLFGVLACLIYGLMLAVSVFMEVAYEYQQFASLAWAAAPLVLVCSSAATILALLADCKLAQSGRRSGLATAAMLLLAAAVGVYLMLRPFLPTQTVTQATFQTWTAQSAYLKDLVYCAAFTLLFVLVPFHFIVSMQRELAAGRHKIALAVLGGDQHAVAPRAAPYLPVWLYGALLVLGAVVSVISTAHLLEALQPSPYRNLFILTIEIRWALFLLLGLASVGWYYSAINELKRECLVMARLSGFSPPR